MADEERSERGRERRRRRTLRRPASGRRRSRRGPRRRGSRRRRDASRTAGRTAQGMPLLRRQDAQGRLQGRAHARQLHHRGRQDCAEPHLGQLRQASAPTRRRDQARARARAAAVLDAGRLAAESSDAQGGYRDGSCGRVGGGVLPRRRRDSLARRHPDDARARANPHLCGRASESQSARDDRGTARDRIRRDPVRDRSAGSPTSCRSGWRPQSRATCSSGDRRSK